VRVPTRREEERDARIDWILDAALQIVVADGIGALTTPRLAKDLGYTPAAFYRYFDSKDALLLALETRTALRYYARFFSCFGSARQALPKLRPRVRALADILLAVRVYSTLASVEPLQFKLVSVLVSGSRSWMTGDASKQLNEQLLPRVAEIIGIFAEASTAGALDDGNAAHRAVGIWIALHAFLTAAPLARASPSLVDLDAVAEDHVTSLLRAWGAKAGELSTAAEAVATVHLAP
jgi:AcrR family transcriptional regulator